MYSRTKIKTMKTKITILLMSFIILASCSQWKGHGNPYEDEDIVLTEDNYIFEGDLYKHALKVEIDSLGNRANDLKKIIDNGQATEEIKMDYTATVQQLDGTVAREATILGYNDLVGKLGPRTAPPRGPAPTVIPPDLKYVVSTNLSTYELVGLDEQGKEVVSSENGDRKIIPGTGGLLQAQKARITDAQYSGAVRLTAKRVNEDGEAAQYTVNAEAGE